MVDEEVDLIKKEEKKGHVFSTVGNEMPTERLICKEI